MDVSPKDHKESRTPAKKNRVSLDTTAEEDDNVVQPRSPSLSPPQSASPPHEIKVRQISQGVEDITWRNNLASGACVTPEREPDALSDFDVTDNHVDPMISEDAGLPSPAATQIEEVPPPSNDSSVASAMEVHVDAPTEPNVLPKDHDPHQTHSRRGSESDGFEREKGLKRKLGDRAISVGPQDAVVAVKATAAIDSLKGSTDISEESKSAKGTKNPSPPLESVSESNQTSTSTTAPKFVRFTFLKLYHS
jgi:Ran-binding protein 3